MAKVPLRVYSREIEDAIEENQIEEAIAHCHHILKTYPKHIETYRLLGKAYHESQRYGNAADIFQRVLSSIPNDFISHLGMSIIREDESNLDAALWHMERAFETQPYNSAIQGELRRLFGKRDGMEPPKIRLTQGALARMYAKGNLYDQAIAELRATLAEDPQRADLQVMLAQMYAKSGQTNEALEICSGLIQRFPYCLEANRIMADLLPETERESDLKLSRQRLQELDPYEAFITEKIPTAKEVSDQAVLINRLDWEGVPVAVEESDEPEWAATAGVSLRDSDNQGEEELPDWLASDPNTDFSFDRGSRDVSTESDEDIPDWMEAAGWGPSTGESDESAQSIVFDEEESADPLSGSAVEADVPGWLQNIAPEGSELSDMVVGQPITAASLDEDLPDWLSSEINSADEQTPTLSDQDKSPPSDSTPDQTPESDDEIPEWLQGLSADSEASGALATVSALEAANNQDIQDESPEPLEDSSSLVDEAAPAEVPDWLKDMADESTSPNEESSPNDIPDWLQDLGDMSADKAPANPQESQSAEESAVPGAIPDWLQELNPEGTPEPPADEPQPAAFVDSPEAQEAGEADAPDWLQGLGADEAQSESAPAVSEPIDELGIGSDTPEEDIPDWLQGIGDDSPDDDSQPAAEALIAADDESPEIINTTEDDIPEWLQDISEEQPAESQEKSTPFPSHPDESTLILGSDDVEMPDWLQELGDDTPAEEPTPEPPAVPVAEEPAAVEADIPDWLQELGDDTPVEEPIPETPEEPVAEEPAAVETDITE